MPKAQCLIPNDDDSTNICCEYKHTQMLEIVIWEIVETIKYKPTEVDRTYHKTKIKLAVTTASVN